MHDTSFQRTADSSNVVYPYSLLRDVMYKCKRTRSSGAEEAFDREEGSHAT